MKLTYHFGIFSKYLYRVSAVSGQVLLLGMTLLITVDVLGRATLGKSTLVSTEISGYALVAIVFLGLAYTLRMERHVRIELLTRNLSPRKQQQLEIAVLILSMVFIAWLAWATCGPVVLNYIQRHTSITYLHTPMWIPYLFVPVGTGMLAIALLIEVIGKLRNLKKLPDKIK